MSDDTTVRILYTNYKGETGLRAITPVRIFFGSTDWHKEPQWLLDALDLDKGENRTFAMKDVRAWIDR